MKTKVTLILLLTLITSFGFSQNLTQTIRGSIIDQDSKTPLIGVTVLIANSNPVVGTSTDANGNFKLDHIPIGRIALQLSYLGYEEKIIPNIIVNSGKEVVLNLTLLESFEEMEEVVLQADQNKGRPVNDMVLISSRSISLEESSRFAGGFNDPSRIVSAYSGVATTQDGSNDIIVRGNSPKYVQWRLEGVAITNPNHFADQNSGGGSGVSALNNNLLATSDFYTGAFSPEYGNVLSGVYDLRLRPGNNEKFESTFGFGLIGTDFTIEGPFKKGYTGSYILNYRYSTASIIADLGLIDVGGIPKYQDLTFKVVLPTKKAGHFSIFGLGGFSQLSLDDVERSLWQTPGDRSYLGNIVEDINKESHLLNSGINHMININKKSFIRTSLSFSSEGIDDNIYESSIVQKTNELGVLESDTINKKLNFRNKLNKQIYRGSVKYDYKINSRNKIQIGTTYSIFDYKNTQSQLNKTLDGRTILVDFDKNINTLRNFISWKHRFSEDLTMITGLQQVNVLLNNKQSLEPRLAFNWDINQSNSIHLGYGKHSKMESVHHYFTKLKLDNGTDILPNKDLDLLKAHHYVIGYQKQLSNKLNLNIEAYYQDLYSLPVENNDSSYFSTINEGLDYKYVDLVNKGTGENYGIEVTIERFFSNNIYYMINGSLFNSKYTTLDGTERNTLFNGNYLFNILCGKEFTKLGKKKNKSLALNAKLYYGGGQKYIPLLRDAQGNLAVDPQNGKFWDYDKAYEKSIEDTYQLSISASYKFNRAKATHEIFLNFDNITNHKGRLSEFYDEEQPNSIGYTTQFGFFPNLMYRVYF